MGFSLQMITNQVVPKFRLAVICLLALLITEGDVLQAFDWPNLTVGEWVEIPTTGDAAPKIFHGGAAIAPERHEVFFFGSDTHHPTQLEKGETNSVWRLNLESLHWSKDYEQDPKSTYRILPDSQTVTTTGRPWAMHTFDCVEWDPVVQRLVVIGFPEHTRFDPEGRFPMFTGNWFKSLRSSHWEYDPDNKLWKRFNFNPPRLFASGLTYDSHRKQLVGTNSLETSTYSRGDSSWSSAEANLPSGWSPVIVYDTHRRAPLLFGNNTGNDTIYCWDADMRVWNRLEASGEVLPGYGAAIAYDSKNSVMIYLANDYHNQYHNPTGKSVTFVYHSADNRWERLDIDSPELYGMNYLTQYDPVRNAILHFEKSPSVSGDRVRLWAFRYR